jgi:uncharacterized membrane protein
MVQAPVGIRCRECGKAIRMPTYDVRPTYYARAFAVGTGSAIGGGILWWAFNEILRFVFQGRLPPLLPSLAALAIGYAAGELISLSVNRKRGAGLAWIAGVSVVVSYFISVGLLPFFDFFGLLFIGAGVYVAVQRVR